MSPLDHIAQVTMGSLASLGAVGFVLASIGAIAFGSPAQPGVDPSPAPWADTGVAASASVCQTITSAAAVDVDALFAGVAAGNRAATRSLVVTYVDTGSTSPVCIGIGDTAVTCSTASAGAAKGVLTAKGQQSTYLLRQRTGSDLPDISARAESADTILCFEIMW